MLVLTRKVGETILIGDNIRITVVAMEEDKVRIGIDAPRELAILRQELVDAVRRENQAAAATDAAVLSQLPDLLAHQAPKAQKAE
ncbi:MAG: carbon storage regulator CsrA [Bacillota bacterium]